MNIAKVVGKSVLKAGKYVGLSAAAAALAGVAGVFDPAALQILLGQALAGDGAAVYVPIIAQLAGGAAGPFIAIALQQVYKHRDKL